MSEAQIAKRLFDLEKRAKVRFGTKASYVGKYAQDPVGYCEHVLHVSLTEQQKQIARALIQPPYRVLVRAAHNVGKTFLAACMISWWYDSYDPGLVLTTAPTDQSVRDVLWREVRTIRRSAGLGGFRGPQMPRLESSADHWAHGFTTRDGEAFQGRHAEHILIVFDESVGVEPVFWETAKTMFAGKGHAWLCIHNPTDTTSTAYLEEHLTDTAGNALWKCIRMSAIEHPNILTEREGKDAPFPSAMRLARFEEMLHEWCSPVREGERKGTDIEWRPGSGNWLRPGPLAEARLLGIWPSQGTYGVWSDALWMKATSADLPIHNEVPQIGCDVARFGDDWTCIHVRVGPVSVYHESFNGWSTSQTAGRLKQLAREWAAWFNARQPVTQRPLEPTEIPIKIDHDGVGQGVIDQAGDYYFVGVSAASSAARPDDYPNVRSELWFSSALKADAGQLSLTRLPRDVLARLQMQAMAPVWKLDSAGRRVVEKKDETKEKIGRSPDDIDAMNLAYHERDFTVVTLERDSSSEHLGLSEREQRSEYESAAQRRGLFGRGRY